MDGLSSSGGEWIRLGATRQYAETEIVIFSARLRRSRIQGEYIPGPGHTFQIDIFSNLCCSEEKYIFVNLGCS